MTNDSTHNATNSDTIQIKEILYFILAKWQWFVLSVMICLSLAITYIVITPPTFDRSAAVLVKNDSKGKSMPSEAEAFSEMGLFKSNTNIKNELYIIKSPLLMEDVVRRLQLDKEYHIRYRSVRMITLYTSTPVAVQLDSTILENSSFGFTIDILGNNKLLLSFDDKNDTPAIETTFFVPVHTPYGKVTLVPTDTFGHKLANYRIYFTKLNTKNAIKTYINNLTVSLNEDDANIINLSIKDQSKKRAEDVLNMLIAVYNENWVKDKNQITLSTSQFINDRLAVIEKELGSVDGDISSFKSANLLPDVTAVSGIALARSSETTTQIITLNNQVSMAKYVRSYMTNEANRNQLLPVNTGMENSAIEAQISQYNNLMLQRNTLLTNSSERNPIVSDMDKTLSSMRELIVGSIGEFVNQLNIQIKNTQQTEKINNQKLASGPTQAKQLLSSERQQKVKEALYLFLLQKREETELSQAFSAYNTKVVNPPAGSEGPIAPRKAVILLAALVVGLVIPGVVLLLLESTNTTIRDKKDLESLTIPFLGEIPTYANPKNKKQSKDEIKKRPIVVKDHSRDMVNEAFRIIRTNIDFVCGKQEKGIVFISTSFHAGSGKTFVTSNLAMSMALKGNRVLLIDLDIRKRTLSHTFGSPKTGITDYLAQKIDRLDEIITKEVLHKNLDLIPAGQMPPNPSELLLSDRLEKAIETLREKYDYIFIDSTPSELVADASITAKHAHYTLFIARAGLLDRSLVPAIEETYQQKKFPNMMVILNDTNSVSRYGYRRYGYGNGYGYGYHG